MSFSPVVGHIHLGCRGAHIQHGEGILGRDFRKHPSGLLNLQLFCHRLHPAFIALGTPVVVAFFPFYFGVSIKRLDIRKRVT